MRVTFLPANVTIDVPEGTTILDAAEAAGVDIPAPCGGAGTCGRCRVFVDGEVDGGRGRLSQEDFDAGVRLACSTNVIGDVVVMVPEAEGGARIVSEHRANEIELDPMTRTVHTTLPPSPEPLWERLTREFDTSSVTPDVMARAAALLPNGGNAIVSDDRLVDVREDGRYGIAVDIGTTTVVVTLVDMEDGAAVGGSAGYNSQIVCGEDVLSRIEWAEANGVGGLRRRLLRTLSELIDQALGDVDRDDVTAACVAGNTAMVHTLLGLDPSVLRYEPYAPTVLAPPVMRASDIGLPISPEALVMIVPGTSAWVGGDITADVVASGMARDDAVSLLIDVGTNGEVALGCDEWMMCCSSSAGPAFEGGEVGCGMRAMDGAIHSFDEDMCFQHFGDAPKGICGSGLIDLLAMLFRTHLVDRAGRLADGDVHVVSEDISVTQDDITNLIRTKAAVYAAASTLLREMGLGFDDVERVLIAGGFGNHIDIASAIAIGLLPDLPEERFVSLGNAALWGARDCLLSSTARDEAMRLRMTYVDLSTSAAFFDEFTSASFLPHTEDSRFPSLKRYM